MDEITPGVFDRTTFREKIRQPVHSRRLADAGVLLDPHEPEDGLGWFAAHGPPTRVVLTKRHHLRHIAHGDARASGGCEELRVFAASV